MAAISQTPETIGFLLIPQFSMIAFAAAIEPLRLANRVSGQDLYKWVVLTPDGSPIKASNEMPFAADRKLGDGPLPSTLIVCGGTDAHWYENKSVLASLRRAASQGAMLGALCTGSTVLARAGLLDGYRSTVHWENRASFAESFPNVELTGDIFTFDRNRMTCGGGTAAADMMLSRIASKNGEQLAAQIAEQMLHDKIRPGAMQQNAIIQQPLGVDRAELQAAVRLMLENIEQPLDLLTLANTLGQSRRNVERLFRKYLNISPARYYLGLRLIRGRQLLYQTQLSVVEVAICCGFVSATHFSKCYRDHFGIAPRTDQINKHYANRINLDVLPETSEEGLTW